MTPRVLIVDDHAGYRSLARELLEGEGVEVVGEASDGESALAATIALRPAVVLLDVYLPGADGFSVAEQLTALPDAPVVVLISSHRAQEISRRLARTPAVGFIPKSQLSAAAIAALVG